MKFDNDQIYSELMATASSVNGSMKPNNDFLKAKNIVLLGGPGSGKGTQAPLIAAYLNIPFLVAGDILRKEAKTNKNVAEIINAGNLVSDDMINQIIKKTALNLSNYVFDGYPRSLSQASFLESYKKIHYAIWIDVSDDILRKRLKERALVSGRADDNDKVIEYRLEVYHQTITPILEFYKQIGKLIRIDGSCSVEEVFKQIKEILK